GHVTGVQTCALPIYVAAGDARVDARDLEACHLLGLGDGGLDRLDRRVDVDDDPAPEAAGGRRPDADDVEAAVRGGLPDHGANLRSEERRVGNGWRRR